MAMRWSTSACLRLRPAAALDRGNREGAHEGKKAMIRRTTVRVSTLRRVVVSLPLLGLLWPRPAGAEEGEKINIGLSTARDGSMVFRHDLPVRQSTFKDTFKAVLNRDVFAGFCNLLFVLPRIEDRSFDRLALSVAAPEGCSCTRRTMTKVGHHSREGRSGSCTTVARCYL